MFYCAELAGPKLSQLASCCCKIFFMTDLSVSLVACAPHDSL